MIEISALTRQREAIRIPLAPQDRSASIILNRPRDNDPTTTALNQYDYYGALLNEKILRQQQKLLMLERILDTLPDETACAILRYYYAMGRTNEHIAEELDISERTAQEKRYTAIKCLERKFKGGKISRSIAYS